jgi:putative SOS response-associated peptidase YedK
MCGRFTLTLEVSALQMAFDLGEQSVEWQPNYNISPSNFIPVVTNQRPDEITLFQWGLVPGWAKDVSIGAKMINARSETVQEKPSFKKAFKERRCLIFTDGFYEWKKNSSEGKTPYYFHRPNQQPFVFAGLWENWMGDGRKEALQTCTILTCAANAIMAPIHDRMPVIMDWKDGQAWLADKSVDSLQAMLKPAQDSFLETYPVSNLVNRPVNNTVECIKRSPNQLLL